MPQPQSPDRVSVIVPTYQSQFLDDALASVDAQRHPADEVIVVDDGSPERSEIRRIVAAHPEVRCIEQDNAGAGAARNAGIRAATGNVVAFLDADDAWLPEFLAEQLQLLVQTGADLVYSDAHLHDLEGRSLGRFTDGAPSDGAVSLESLITQACTVLTSSVVARRDALLSAGLFDPSLRRGQDFDLWLRLVGNGGSIRYTTRPLLRRRVHAAGLSGTPARELERALNVLQRAETLLPLSPHEQDALHGRVRQLRGDLYREYGKESIATRQFSAARQRLAQSYAVSPSWKLGVAIIGLHVAPRLVGAIIDARSTRRARIPAAR